MGLEDNDSALLEPKREKIKKKWGRGIGVSWLGGKSERERSWNFKERGGKVFFTEIRVLWLGLPSQIILAVEICPLIGFLKLSFLIGLCFILD